MSLIFFPMSIGFMSRVDFKKWLCRPVDFYGSRAPWGTVAAHTIDRVVSPNSDLIDDPLTPLGWYPGNYSINYI